MLITPARHLAAAHHEGAPSQHSLKTNMVPALGPATVRRVRAGSGAGAGAGAEAGDGLGGAGTTPTRPTIATSHQQGLGPNRRSNAGTQSRAARGAPSCAARRLRLGLGPGRAAAPHGGYRGDEARHGRRRARRGRTRGRRGRRTHTLVAQRTLRVLSTVRRRRSRG